MPKRTFTIATDVEVLLGGLLLALSACSHGGPRHVSEPDDSATGTIEDNDAARAVNNASGAASDASMPDPVKPTADGGLAQTGTQDAGPPRGTAVETSKICDGSKSLRVGFEGSRSTGCGPDYPCPGLAVLMELGGSYLYLDGQCNLYMKKNTLGGTRTKKLAAAELDALVARLRVADWPPTGTYCRNAGVTFDGAGARYYLTGSVIVVNPCVDTSRPTVDTSAYEYVIDHYAEGEPATGPVRYTLVPAVVANHPSFAGAKAFPLKDPKVVVPSVTTNGVKTAAIMVADGADAEKLRALRESWLQNAGAQPGDFIPVLDANDANPSELRVRDVLPIEENPGHSLF